MVLKKKTVSRPTKPVVVAAQSLLPSSPADGAVTQASMPPPQFPLVGGKCDLRGRKTCYVCHTNEPLPFRHHFGHEGGIDQNMTFKLRQELSVFRITDKDCVEAIIQASSEILRTLVMHAKFESLSRKPFVKPAFFFGDFIDFETDVAYEGITSG